jgi:NAD(P)-dependent dehydrogenase (short-subunit alcohol dehydrogenase family)
LAPDLIYPSGPIETLAPEIWSEELNTKVIATIATARAFLPSVCEFQARVLILTPNVVSSLQPAFHSLESTIIGALYSFTTTLQRELNTLGIKVCQLRLGNFDFSGGHGARHHLQPISESRTITWPPSARLLYAQNFINQGRIAAGRGLFGESGSVARGSSPRELHNAVFDALSERHPRKVWRVGRGSVAYDIVGNWVPSGLVGWVLGLRRVSLEEMAGPGPQIKMEDSTVHSWEKIDRTPSPG